MGRTSHGRKARSSARQRRGRERPRRQIGPPLLAAILFAITFLVFVTGYDGAFVLDDQVAILNNARVQAIGPLSRFLDSSQPLFELSFAVNVAMGGRDATGFHIVNILIHCIAAALLMAIIWRTLSAAAFSDSIRARAMPLAFWIALLWAVHPLQTGSVTYVVQRAESMMGCLFLLTLYAAIRAAVAARPVGWMILAIVACAAGMATKAVMVVGPVVVALYFWTFDRSTFGSIVRRRAGLFAGLAATWGVLIVTGTLQGVFDRSIPAATVGFAYRGVSPMEYLRTQPQVILHYLSLCVWPVRQCLDYGWPVETRRWVIAWTSIVVMLLLAATVYLLIRRRPAGFAAAWFFLILAPTSSFIPIKDLAFEHRMYLPLAGVVAILVVAGAHQLNRSGARSGEQKSSATTVSRFALPVLAAGCIFLTVSRNRLYADGVALLQATAECAPNNPRPLNALGHVLLMDGQYAEAMSVLERARELDPTSPSPYANMGMTLVAMGDSARAVEQFDRAWGIRQAGYFWNVHYFYGVALLDSDRALEAIEQFRIVLGQQPGHASSLYNLGNALRLTGQLETAVGVYQDALKANPAYAEAWVNMGLTLLDLRRADEAVAAFRRSLRISGASDDARFKGNYHLGRALLHRGLDSEAAAHFRAALRIIPDHPGALDALRMCGAGPTEP